MRPTEGILEILVAAGVGVIAPGPGAWPIYEGQLGDINQAISIREPGGRTPEVRIAIDYPTIQILVRGERDGYAITRTKADEIFLALQAIPSSPPGWPELTSCIAVGGVTFAGYDEVKRPVWSLNFNLIVSKAPEGYRDL